MIDLIFLTSTLETEEERITARRLFEKYQNAMYWIAFRILQNETDAEDAVMRAMENICHTIKEFRSMDEQMQKLRISSIVRNAAIDMYRRKEKITFQELEEYVFMLDEKNSTTIEEALPHLFRDHDFGTLQKYVTQLKEKYKRILILRYGENRSNKEISRLLGIPESTVATQLERAKKELKKKIEEAEKRHETDA